MQFIDILDNKDNIHIEAQNADEILSNKRTKEMLEKYHPADVQGKLIMQKLMRGKLEELCRYYKMICKIKSAVRQFIKGRKR